MKSPTYNNMMLHASHEKFAVARTFRRAANYNISIANIVRSRVSRYHFINNKRAVDIDAPVVY